MRTERHGSPLDPRKTRVFLDPPSRFTPKGDQGSSRGIARPFFASRTLLSSSVSLYSYFSHRKVNFHIFHSHVKIIRGEVACTINLLEISFGETSCKTLRLARPRGWVNERSFPRRWIPRRISESQTEGGIYGKQKDKTVFIVGVTSRYF